MQIQDVKNIYKIKLLDLIKSFALLVAVSCCLLACSLKFFMEFHKGQYLVQFYLFYTCSLGSIIRKLSINVLSL